MSASHRRFELKTAHIALVSALITRPEKLALVGSDSKQSPFTETGDLIDDIAMIIIGKEFTDEEKEAKKAKKEHFYTRDNEEELLEIYKELPTALEIILTLKSFEPGPYLTRHYVIDWKKGRADF